MFKEIYNEKDRYNDYLITNSAYELILSVKYDINNKIIETNLLRVNNKEKQYIFNGFSDKKIDVYLGYKGANVAVSDALQFIESCSEEYPFDDYDIARFASVVIRDINDLERKHLIFKSNLSFLKRWNLNRKYKKIFKGTGEYK